MKPKPVVELARAKVNLALHITGRREDGYHELDSIVAFADVGDRLTFVPSDCAGISIAYEGPFGETLRRADDDIVLKAASLLQADRKQAGTGLQITLEKNLPLSSGIGGGSADAAATLRGLVQLWQINIIKSDLLALALKLGADLPVCLLSQPTRMTGIGGYLEPLPSLPSFHAVLVNPGTPLATKAVFAELGLSLGHRGFGPIIMQNSDDRPTHPPPKRAARSGGGGPRSGGGGALQQAPHVRRGPPPALRATSPARYAWEQDEQPVRWPINEPLLRLDQLLACRNDLETPAIKLVPEIADVLAALKQQDGVVLARMSGSGATCFGLFENQMVAEKAAQRIGGVNPSWWTVATTLS